MTQIDKAQALDMLRSRLAEALAGLTDSQEATQAGAIHEETRAEDPKDTRATEASYLARGLARLVAELTADTARLAAVSLTAYSADDAVGVTALVGLEDEAERASVVFLLPAGAGETLELDGATIRPVTPSSPLGRSLVGRFVGDDVEAELPGGPQHFRISWIA